MRNQFLWLAFIFLQVGMSQAFAQWSPAFKAGSISKDHPISGYYSDRIKGGTGSLPWQDYSRHFRPVRGSRPLISPTGYDEDSHIYTEKLSFCQGDVATISAVDLQDVKKLKWRLPGGQIIRDSTVLQIHNFSQKDAGWYVLKLEYTSGTITTDSLLLFFTAGPEVYVPGNISICNNTQMDSLVFTNSSTCTCVKYAWTNSDTSINLASSGSGGVPSFTASNKGDSSVTATITVTPFAGCYGDAKTFTITVNPVPNIIVPAGQVLCNGATSNPVDFTADITGTTFQWETDHPEIGLGKSGAGDIPSFKASNNDTLPVKALITVKPVFEGCSGIAKDVLVTVLPALRTDFGINDNEQCKSCNSFSFSPVINTDTVASTYKWTFGDGLGSLSFAPVHSYTTEGAYTVSLVTVNGNGCSDSISKVVQVTGSPQSDFTYSMIATSNNVFNFNYSSITDTSLLNFHWDFGDGAVSNLINPAHTYFAAGVYNVRLTVTDKNGCQSTAGSGVIVKKNNQNVASFTIDNDHQCLLGNLFSFSNTSLLDTGDKITAIRWDFGDGSTDSIFHPLHKYTLPGDYTVKLSVETSSGLRDSVVRSVTVSSPNLRFNPDRQVFCDGALTNPVLWDSSSSGITYTWINSRPDIGLAASGSGNYLQSFKAINQSTGQVEATITVIPYADGCEGNKYTFTVAVNPSASASQVYAVDTVVCREQPAALHVQSFYTDALFTWYSDPLLQHKVDEGATLLTGKLSSDTVYYITVSAPGICENATGNAKPLHVFLHSPVDITVTDPSRVCNGMPANLTSGHVIDEHGHNYTYAFYTDTAALTPLVKPDSVYSPGKYFIRATDPLTGCASEMMAVNVDIAAPLQMQTLVKDASCFGYSDGGIDIQVAGSNNTVYKYVWNGPNSFYSESQNISKIAIGEYHLLIKDDKGCAGDTTLIVRQPETMKINSKVTAAHCYGDKSGAIELTVSGANPPYSFLWNNKATSQNLYNLNTASYNVVVTDANGCKLSTSDIWVPGSKEITVHITPPSAVCDPAIIDLTSPALIYGSDNGLQYSYYSDSAATQGLTDPSTVKSAGTYYLKAINDSGCFVISPVNVVINSKPAKPMLTLDGNAAFCYGGKTVLRNGNSQSNYSFQWYNNGMLITGANANNYTASEEGVYSLLVKSTEGCMSDISDAVQITVYAMPVLTVFPLDTTIGKGSVIQFAATGTNGNIQWTQGTGLDDLYSFKPKARVLNNTTFTATLTSPEGCSVMASALVKVNNDIDLTPCKLVTPNGDGIHDRFYIKNIDAYPDNHIQVFDKAGKIVYDKKSYNNEWNCSVNGGVLANDTYYYVLTVNGNIFKKGTFTVISSY